MERQSTGAKDAEAARPWFWSQRNVNRADLQAMAQQRIEDVEILLANGRWAASYYLAGYVIEYALKSCVLAFVERTGAIFLDKKFSERCFTHNPTDLLKQADLEVTLGVDIGANAALGIYWGAVTKWTEASRYEPKSETEARELHEAITHDPNGVFLWLKNHW